MNHPRLALMSAVFSMTLLSACGGGGTGDDREPPASPAPAPSPTHPTTPPTTPTPTPQPAVTAVGTPIGPVVASARIGAAGGRLDAPDYGLAVVVPPGAFASEQLVTLQPIDNHAPGARGGAWRIQPEGVIAQQPITLEWLPSAAERNGARHLRIATQGQDGVWRSAKASTDVDGIVRTRTTHFSDWSLVAGVQLRPGAAEVGLSQTQEVTVKVCGRGDDAALPGQELHFECVADGSAVLGTDGWAVNGVAAGNAAVGTLSGHDSLGPLRRTYRAPAALPVQNPVAVSVNYRDPFDDVDGPVQLVAHLTVIDPQAGCNWLTGVDTLVAELEQDYHWAGGDAQGTARYAHRARVAGRLHRDPLSPVGSVWFAGSAETGSIAVDQFYSSAFAADTIQVTAQGGPAFDPALPPLLRAFVNLTTCKLDLVGHVPVPARHLRTFDGVTSEMDAQVSGLSFRVADYPLAGRRTFGQERLLPVLIGPRDRAEWVAPESHREFPGVSGSARLRWTLQPQ